MQNCHWNASEIVEKINAGDKSLANGMLQSEMNKLRDDPKEFKKLVEEMARLTKADTNDSNDVEFDVDGKGNITSVTINDGYFFDTVLARKGAPTPLNLLASLNGDCTINK